MGHKKFPGVLFMAAMCVAATVTFSGNAHADAEPHLGVFHSDRLVIRLINADTGEPMSHQNVLVEWDADAEESTIYVGGKGRGTMLVVEGTRNFTMKPGTKDYGDPTASPSSVAAAPPSRSPVDQAIHKGFIAHNECNGRTVEINPGEIVFWARPLPLWKPDFQ
ncbi:MAG TPA: hypothetical protein VGJ21_01105 [Terracidiphilus sp.]|jgi:hypothetical protein